jgi:hypothetical protein
MYGFGYIPHGLIVGGFSGLDTHAALFLRTARITDERITYAINRLVMDLKRLNLWDKIHCLYPFVGAAATPHTINLKAPASNALAYAGGTFTHSTGGVVGTGSLSATTGFLCSSLAADSYSVGFYARTQATEAGSRIYIGAATGVGGTPGVWIAYTGSALSLVGTNQTASRTLGIRNSVGFIIGSRTSLTDLALYRNGDQLATNTGTASGSLPATAISVFSLAGLLPTPSTCGLAFIGKGLTHPEVWNLTQAVQNFENILQRAV